MDREQKKPFVAIDEEVYLSQAFQTMGASGQALMLSFCYVFRLAQNAFGHQWISFGPRVKENPKLGRFSTRNLSVTTRTFERTMPILVARGLVQMVHQNGGRAVYRPSDSYKLWDAERYQNETGLPEKRGQIGTGHGQNHRQNGGGFGQNHRQNGGGTTAKMAAVSVKTTAKMAAPSYIPDHQINHLLDLAPGESSDRPLDSPGLDPGNNGTCGRSQSTLRVEDHQSWSGDCFASNGTSKPRSKNLTDEGGDPRTPQGPDPRNQIPEKTPPWGSPVRGVSGIKRAGDVAAALIGRIRHA